MSTPLDPVAFPRVEPTNPLRRVERRQPKRDESERRPHDEDTGADEPEDDDDGGLHIDVLA